LVDNHAAGSPKLECVVNQFAGMSTEDDRKIFAGFRAGNDERLRGWLVMTVKEPCVILKNPGIAGNDVVLIIDTTNSMTNDIRNLKEKKDEILQKLKDKSNHPDLKLSLIAYRDKNNSYLAKILRDFTSSARSFGGAIDELSAGEGNKDISEAVLDALELASSELSWRADTKKSVILASDAPGFPVSYSNQTFEQIIEKYSQENHQIAIYSILAGSLE
jgi:Mg-chelatase subunit ChlD